MPVRCRAARDVRQPALCRNLPARSGAGEAGHDAAPRSSRPASPAAPTATSTAPSSSPMGLHSFGQGALAGRPPGGRTFHLRPAPADAGRRRGQHARGRHRARDAQDPSRAAERAARRRHGEHVAGLGHVRRRAAARHMQPGLRRHVRPDPGTGEARHDRARDPAMLASPTASMPCRQPRQLSWTSLDRPVREESTPRSQELADGRIITVGAEARRTAAGSVTHRGHHRAPEAECPDSSSRRRSCACRTCSSMPP